MSASNSLPPMPSPWTTVTQFVDSVSRCYAEVLFINRGGAIGICILLCTMVNPNIGLSGLLAVVASYVTARLIHLDHSLFQPGFYTYNPLLVGLGLGSALQLNWLSAFFCVIVSVLTLFLTSGMFHLFRHYLNLPVLSLPFAAVSVVTYLSSLRYSNLIIQEPSHNEFLHSTFGLPLVIVGFCKSLGAIFLMPYVCIGLLFAAMLLFGSRILFTLAVLGYLVGTLVRAALLGSTVQAFGDIGSFNFILIAMALGGIFLTHRFPAIWSRPLLWRCRRSFSMRSRCSECSLRFRSLRCLLT